jgi:hypothetical protein
LSVLTRSADHRHKFAHCIWGVSQDPKLRDALLLVAPQHFWKMRARRLQHWKRFRNRDLHLAARGYPRLDPKMIQVYQKPELEGICQEIEQAFRYANALMNLVDSKPDKRKLVLRLLSEQPPIREVLDKERLRLSEQRKAQRERDRARRLADQRALKRRDAKKEYKAKHAT